MMADTDFKSELEANYDAQAELDELEAGDKKPDVDPKAKESFAPDLEKTWTELETKPDAPGDDDDAFEGQDENLAAMGMDRTSYNRAIRAFAGMSQQNPNWYPQALDAFQRGESLYHPFQQVHRLAELNRFAKSHPDVMDVDTQSAMVTEMQRDPPKPREPIGKAIKRAYDAVKAGKQRVEDRSRMSEIRAAIDATADELGYK